MADEKLTLRNVKVVFANLQDTGRGTSITIDCTEPTVKKQIEDWVAANKIGKDNPGVAKFKEYTNDKGVTTLQYNFKITDYTQYAGVNGLSKDNLGRGAVVDLIARAFTYANKFTGGKEKVGQNISAVVIRSGASNSNDADLADLLGDMEEPEEGTNNTVDSLPF